MEQTNERTTSRVIIAMKALRVKSLWALLKDSAIAWGDDDIGTQGAALAYFSVFSLAPLLILVIVLSSLGFGQAAASGRKTGKCYHRY